MSAGGARADAAAERERARKRERMDAFEARKASGNTTAEDDDWEATGDAYEKKLKTEAARKDAAESRKAREQHDAGVKAGKAAAKKRTATKRKVASTAKRKTGAAAKTTKRVAKRVPRQVRSARQGSVTGIFVSSLVLVGLYVFLTQAQTDARTGSSVVTGFLAGPGKAMQWLASPTAVIPFKKGTP